MTSVELLHADDPAARARWLALWNAWPGREVFAHPAYGALFAQDGRRAACAVLTRAEGAVLFPFLLRPIAEEPWGSGIPGVDLVTPYGYGAAYVHGSIDANEFWDGFDAAVAPLGLVSLFARHSLFPEQEIAFRGVQQVRASNIVRSVDIPEDLLWHDVDHKVRKNVGTARRAGLRVTFDEGDRLDEFLAIYRETMIRRGAAPQYFFDERFFRSLLASLPGSFVFAHVEHEGRIVSTELVLVSAENIYSFLGGTTAESFPQRPNDLLKFAVIGWGREHGKRSYVLGGGYQPDDGIFRYKRSFAPSGAVPFRTSTRIMDAEAYENCVQARRDWEGRHARALAESHDYFPAYRAPAVEPRPG